MVNRDKRDKTVVSCTCQTRAHLVPLLCTQPQGVSQVWASIVQVTQTSSGLPKRALRDEVGTNHFAPQAGIMLAAETTRDFDFVGMLPGTVHLTPINTKIEHQRKQAWQRCDVSRRRLSCAAAFVCTNYKVQGRMLDQVALKLRG